MAGIFCRHSVVLWILAVAFQGCRAQPNSSMDFNNCWVDAEQITYLGWARHDEGLGPSRPAADYQIQTQTATILTTVNTVLNSTEVSTMVPPGWTQPPTNAAGTQIQVVQLYETNVTLAFPTPFIRWPKHYTYSTYGQTEATTVSITSPPPQPTEPMALDPIGEAGIVGYVDPERISDPKGILAKPMFFYATRAWGPAYTPLLAADYPAFRCNTANGGGPNWGGLDKTWMKIVTSTMYTNAEPTSLPDSR